MLLYLITSNGSSREDANVFYAKAVLFDEPVSRTPDIDAALRSVFSGAAFAQDDNHISVTFDSYDDYEEGDPVGDRLYQLEELFQNGAAVIAELVALGFKAALPEYRGYVINDRG